MLRHFILTACFFWTGISHALSEGAYAFGQGPDDYWAVGSAYNVETEAEAQGLALARCRAVANPASVNCRILTNVTKQCFSFSIQKRGSNAFGWRVNSDRNVAVTWAHELCQLHASCRTVDTFCDTVHGAAKSSCEQICSDTSIVVGLECRRLEEEIDGTVKGSDLRRCYEERYNRVDCLASCEH
jgi:hypothetical protein